MGRVKPCRDDKEHEKSIRFARRDFINGIEPSIRSAARPYNIPYTTEWVAAVGKELFVPEWRLRARWNSQQSRFERPAVSRKPSDAQELAILTVWVGLECLQGIYSLQRSERGFGEHVLERSSSRSFVRKGWPNAGIGRWWKAYYVDSDAWRLKIYR